MKLMDEVLSKDNLNQAKCVSNTRKGYQHICRCWSITKAINNSRLKKRGLIEPLEYYLKPTA